MRTANSVTHVVTDYGPDPHNPAAGAVHDAMARVHGFLVRVVGVADDDPSQTFGGLAAPVQDFTGAAGPTAGGNPVTYRDGAYPEVSGALVEGPMGDPARRIFAARLQRGRA